MPKQIVYSETIPDERSKYFCIFKNKAFFCFDVNRSNLLPAHEEAIRKTVLPFVLS